MPRIRVQFMTCDAPRGREAANNQWMMRAITLSDDGVAARAVEAEGILHGVADLRRQPQSQRLVGAVQPRLDRLLGDLQALGGLGRRQPFDRAQHEDGAVRDAERVDGALEQGLHLLPRGNLLGGGAGRLGFVGHGVIVLPGRRLGPMALAEPGVGLVDRDAGHPGREAGPALEAVQVLVGADVGLLHHVLDVGVVAEDGPHGPVDPLVVPPHQHLETGGLAGADPLDQRVVGLGGGSGRRDRERRRVGVCMACHGSLHSPLDAPARRR